MAGSSTEICNLALVHLAQSLRIASLTEATNHARVFNRIYDEVRKEMLRDYNWPFAKKTQTLALVGSDPTTEWGYSYALPSDCVMFRRILSAKRKEDSDSKIEYLLYHGAAATVIYSDETEAVGEYTADVTDTGRYPADFVMAFAYRLAAYAAPAIVGGSYPQLLQLVDRMWRMSVSKAAATALNEQARGKQVEAEWIRYRNE